jgi:hypothetical protein
VVPNVNVLVLAMLATVNPPGPVLVKLVTVAILNTTVAAVVCVRLIFPADKLPKAIERTLTFDELNMPVFKVAPSAIVSVPDTNEYVPVVACAYVLLNVTVPAFCVNVGVAPSVAVPPYVKEPVFKTKLVVGVSVPAVKVSVGPFNVNVVH